MFGLFTSGLQPLTQPIEIPPGYYTYQALAAKLGLEGYTVDVSRAQARVLAMSLSQVSLMSLARAIRSSTGDTVTVEGTSLTISTSPDLQRRLKSLSTAYIKDYVGQVNSAYRVFFDAFEEFRQSSARAEARTRLRDRMDAEPKNASAIHFALQLENGEIGRALPLLAQNDLLEWKDGLPKTFVNEGSMGNYANRLFPFGDKVDARNIAPFYTWCNVDPKRANAAGEIGNRIALAYGLTFDPLSGALGGEYLLASDDQLDENVVSSTSVVPGVTTTVCRWNSYLSRTELADLEARTQLTSQMLDGWNSTTESVEIGSSRPSGKVLDWAVANKHNVVFPVSPISDVASDTTADSIGNFLRSLLLGTRRNLVPGWAHPPDDPNVLVKPSLTPCSTYTASLQGEILSVKDEMEFLSGLTSIGEPVAANLDQKRFTGRVVLGDLIEAATNKVWLTYNGTPPCAGLQAYGDFVGAVPFLRMVNASETVKTRLSSLKPGENFSIPVSQMDSRLEKSLLRDLQSCSTHLNVGAQFSNQRLFAWLPDAMQRLDLMTLSCDRDSQGLSFQLKSTTGGVYWNAQLSGF